PEVDLTTVPVGNLPYQTSEEAVGNHFSQAGHVTNVKIVYDRETGRMKGFGFCDFADAAGASNAVNTLNGADFGGRQLRYPVYFFVAASNSPINSATMGSRGVHSVYVGNLPYQTSEEAVGNHFSQAGHVTNVKIVYDRETGRMKGFGFCDFADAAGASNAVNTLNGADFSGRQLRVNYANRN
ncbi:unnamed protein product, partial [Haemonchus placei]|uniref:RRM domain-containing protein n=1 Tax=Haemonchus placei TaxID=6290 RepID=A0A0N4XAY8_HAEPC